jgi:transposase, IS30 family
MPKNGYQHLTYDLRCQIYALKKSNKPVKEIASFVNVCRSTIYRELGRNSGARGYRYKQAHEMAVSRRFKASSVQRKMTTSTIALIENYLKEEQWSPEQIAGRLKIEHGIEISHESIYSYIWEDKRNGGMLYKNLRRRSKKYNKRGSKTSGRGLIPDRKDIEERPSVVEERTRFGDFEVDTIVGAHHKGAIVSMVDRKTKYVCLQLVQKGSSINVAEAMIKKLSIFDNIHTITSDNGKEFADHKNVSTALGVEFYFAKPYHAWERGLNENTNGLVRQYFPKSCDFTKLTEMDIVRVENLLNNRPRKTLNYLKPIEVVRSCIIGFNNVALQN